jgi:hypothetical protein
MTIRCVDWETEKANERESMGSNRSDPYILALSQGLGECEYVRGEKLDLENDKSPCVFRGLGKSPEIHKCIEKGIDFYYVDTGYFGNPTTKKWHRIAKNNLQTIDHKSLDRVYDILTNDRTIVHPKEFNGYIMERFKQVLGDFDTFKITRRKKSDKILFVPPSQKVFNHFGANADEWIESKMKEFKNYTNKEIVLRPKVSRSQRVSYSVQKQLVDENFDSLITFNSIASIEAIIQGFPATVLGPNAGSYLSNTDITMIDNPRWPKLSDIKDHLFYLSLCQFTSEEMSNGFAWRIIRNLQKDLKPLEFKL